MLQLTAALNLACFSDSYAAARQVFVANQGRVAAALHRRAYSFTHPQPGPQGEALSCDVLHLGQSDRPQHVLVLISGTHGVEGFAGSAIQSDAIALLAPLLERQPSLAVVLIHAINPWGFAWLRRYDHQGIDLNRNFVNFDGPLPDNPDYQSLHERILQCQDVDAANLHQLWSDLDAQSFLQAVVRGQYCYSDGLFYGGSAASWSRTVLEQLTAAPLFSRARRIAVIDLHTGLGPYGYGEVINDHPLHSAGFLWAQRWYRHNAQSTELGNSVSSPKPGLLDYHWHRLIGDRGCFVTLEFGTWSSQHLLAALINEQLLYNRSVHTGAVRDINAEPVQQLQQFFYPAERSWQQQVLFRGRQVMSLALEGMLL